MPNTTSELAERQAIVQQIIDVFDTQERLARACEIDQSAVSLWKKNGEIPARRQRQIIKVSEDLFGKGQIKTVIEPADFHRLREHA